MIDQDITKCQELAKKYGVPKVYCIKANVSDDNDEVAVGYLKWPGRTPISIAMSIQERDPLKAKEIVLRAAWLEGDVRILDDEYTFCNACTVLDDLIAFRQAVIKKNTANGQ